MFCSAANSFDSSPQLGKICLLVHVLNKISPFFCLCSHMRCWMSLFSLGSSDEVGSLLRRSYRLVITSSISAGTGSSLSLCRPVGMRGNAALSKIVRGIFSSLWQSVGRNACSGWPPSLFCICPSWPSLG